MQNSTNVLKVYKKFNPSIIKKELLKKYLLRRNKIIIDHLKLPKQNFKNKTVLDLACGTGEISLSFALMGAKVYCVDASPIAIKKTKELFKKCGLEKNLINTKVSLLEKFNTNKKFDIVNVEGILHHLVKPYLIINKINKFLKKDSILILGFLSDYGFFQKFLQKVIINKFSKNEKEIFKNVKYLFSEGLKRAANQGRPSDNIIADMFLNPIVKSLSIKKILHETKKNNLIYYSSFPSIETDKIMNLSNENFFSFSQAFKKNKHSYMFIKLLDHMISNSEKQSTMDNKYLEKKTNKLIKKWELFFKKINIHNYKNQKLDLNRFYSDLIKIKNDTIKYQKNVNKIKNEKFSDFFTDLIQVFKLKNKKNFKRLKLKNVFKGSEGTPFNYLVFYKI